MQRRTKCALHLTGTLAALALISCGEAPSGREVAPIEVEEQEVALFADQVAENTFQQGCDRLAQLCQEQQRGCEAHKTFCAGGASLADLKARICAKLTKLAEKFPRARHLVEKHCAAAGAAPGDGGATPAPAPRADGGVPGLPPWPAHDGAVKIPDRAACCAALKICVDSKGQDCQAALKACAPTGAIPSLPQLPGGQLPAGVNVEAILKQLYDRVCGQPAAP